MEVFDRGIALRQAKGDLELVKKRCESFSRTAEAALGSFQQALETKDVASLRRLADELRTTSVEVGAAGIENLIAQFLDALLSHDAGSDTCRSLIPRSLRFDLGPLKRHCRETFPEKRGTVVLLLEELELEIPY